MPTEYIKCPKCSHKIALSKAMNSQIQEEIEKEYQVKLEKELEKRERTLEAHYEKEREKEYQELKDKTDKKLKRQYENQLKDKLEELAESKKELDEARKKEKELMLQKMEFEKKQHEKEVQFIKNMEKEAKNIRNQESASAQEKYSLQIREKDKIINDLRKKMEEGSKKAKQGSMQLQGEVQEQELEEILKKHFPQDEISPVKTGQRGGDIIQVIKTPNGNIAGKILWESKRTKNWSQGWLKKLKDDMQLSKCDCGAVVSEVLPEQIKNFGFGLIEGVWITELRLAIGLAAALRQNLQDRHALQTAIEHQSDKKEVIYNYLTGKQFKNRVERVIETFSEMQADLNKEKQAIEKIWAKRDKQIEVFIRNMSGIYGDLQGCGANLEQIKILELSE